ncbi:MAG: hypothetical protein HY917_04175, partial [Candidatus Diapherotrites archaeon]|nr:hypothetical protein [Candidatus Diapherotrites archaeon]
MSLEQLRKGIEEEKKSAGRKEDEIDQNTIEKIVKRINQKYSETVYEPGETPSEKLSELRGLIADPSRAKFQMQTVEELQEYQNPAVRNIGRTFLAFRS